MHPRRDVELEGAPHPVPVRLDDQAPVLLDLVGHAGAEARLAEREQQDVGQRPAVPGVLELGARVVRIHPRELLELVVHAHVGADDGG